MAGLDGGGHEDLIRTGDTLNDALRQLKLATRGGLGGGVAERHDGDGSGGWRVREYGGSRVTGRGYNRGCRTRDNSWEMMNTSGQQTHCEGLREENGYVSDEPVNINNDEIPLDMNEHMRYQDVERVADESCRRANQSQGRELNLSCALDQQVSDEEEELTNELKFLKIDPRHQYADCLRREGYEEEMMGQRYKYDEHQDNAAADIRDIPSQYEVLDWEEDVSDPFEQAMARRVQSDAKNTRNRPNSAQEATRVSGGQESSQDHGRSLGVPENLRRSGSYTENDSQQDVRQCPESGGSWYGNIRGGQQHRGRGQHHVGGNQQEYRRQPYHTRERDYEEKFDSSRGAHSLNNLSGGGGGLRPWELVEALAECPNFSASLLNLLEWKNMQPRAIREAAAAHTHVFQLDGETVVLQPELDLCLEHPGPKGCQDLSSCNSLHMCPNFARSWCSDRECTLGHRWFTDHNKTVLRLYYMERLPFTSLKKVMQNNLAALPPSGQLDVCRQYNGQGCSRQNCPHLHVCLHFVTGLTKCGVAACNLSHNLLAPECCTLLRAHGFSTNETPRDVAVALVQACPALAAATPPSAVNTQRPSTTALQTQQAPTRSSDTQQAYSIASGTKRGFTNSSGTQWASTRLAPQHQGGINDSRAGGRGILSIMRQKLNSWTSGEATDSSVSQGGSGARRQEGGSVSGVMEQRSHNTSVNKATATWKNEKRQTVWSHYLYGDTEINEICYYSVEATCRNEGSGCQRLHAFQHFHWQISEQGNKWFNLRPFQTTCLERAFCDPEKDGVDVPRLDPAKLSQSLGKLLTVLGRDTWKANFLAMILCNSDQSRILYLRRLCTQYIPGQQVKASTYSWFFCDKNKKWVKYGKVDTAGETNLVSSLTSTDIEKHYNQQQHVPLTFTNANFTYVLDFVRMTQTNQSTKVKREVRRRPQLHLKN